MKQLKNIVGAGNHHLRKLFERMRVIDALPNTLTGKCLTTSRACWVVWWMKDTGNSVLRQAKWSRQKVNASARVSRARRRESGQILLATRNQIIQRFDVMLLEISPELHIRPDTKVNTVLFLNSTNVGVVTLIT